MVVKLVVKQRKLLCPAGRSLAGALTHELARARPATQRMGPGRACLQGFEIGSNPISSPTLSGKRELLSKLRVGRFIFPTKRQFDEARAKAADGKIGAICITTRGLLCGGCCTKRANRCPCWAKSASHSAHHHNAHRTVKRKVCCQELQLVLMCSSLDNSEKNSWPCCYYVNVCDSRAALGRKAGLPPPPGRPIPTCNTSHLVNKPPRHHPCRTFSST